MCACARARARARACVRVRVRVCVCVRVCACVHDGISVGEIELFVDVLDNNIILNESLGTIWCTIKIYISM